jgi:predicted nucleic acid-binding protein
LAKHLIDTDLYIDLIRTGETLPFLNILYEKETPGIYFSSVVSDELLAGAKSRTGRRNVEALLRPFERAGRIVTPTHQNWRETGVILSELMEARIDLKSKLAGLANDCLLALSARSIGATLYTRNRTDFSLIQKLRPFSLVIIH